MKIPESIQEVNDKATCIYNKQQVEAALDQMALKISEVLESAYPVVLCVMVGGIIPTASLLSRMNFPLELDYIHATRYHGTTRAGELEWRHKPNCVMRNRTILIVDDILDSGITLAAMAEFCKQQGAKDVYTAVLVDKKHPRDAGGTKKADFTGLHVEDHYVFGYGMDYREYLRNAPGIYMVADEHA